MKKLMLMLMITMCFDIVSINRKRKINFKIWSVRLSVDDINERIKTLDPLQTYFGSKKIKNASVDQIIEEEIIFQLAKKAEFKCLTNTKEKEN